MFSQTCFQRFALAGVVTSVPGAAYTTYWSQWCFPNDFEIMRVPIIFAKSPGFPTVSRRFQVSKVIAILLLHGSPEMHDSLGGRPNVSH